MLTIPFAFGCYRLIVSVVQEGKKSKKASANINESIFIWLQYLSGILSNLQPKTDIKIGQQFVCTGLELLGVQISLTLHWFWKDSLSSVSPIWAFAAFCSGLCEPWHTKQANNGLQYFTSWLWVWLCVKHVRRPSQRLPVSSPGCTCHWYRQFCHLAECCPLHWQVSLAPLLEHKSPAICCQCHLWV